MIGPGTPPNGYLTEDDVRAMASLGNATPEQLANFRAIAIAAEAFMVALFHICPSSPDRSEALRLARKAKHAAIDSIRHEGKY